MVLRTNPPLACAIRETKDPLNKAIPQIRRK